MRSIVLCAIALSLPWLPAKAAERETLPPRYQGVIAEKCFRDLDRFDTRLHESGFGVLAPGTYKAFSAHRYFLDGGSPRQQIRTLRKAANDLAMRGNEAECQVLLGSMRKLYSKHQRAGGREGSSPKKRTAWRRAHLARAHRVTAMNRPIHAAILIGAELRNIKDQRLGEIVDVIFGAEQARAQLVLVARGGFLGFGGDIVAVRWNDLRATEDHELFVLDVKLTDFKKAPIINGLSLPKVVRGPWRDALDKFWENALADQQRN